MELKEIEQQLGTLVSSDKKRWVEIYELMHEVDEKKLYKNGYKSFTAWVNEMATRYNVHVSLLWERNKAGKFYKKIYDAMELRGEKLKSLNEVNTTSESLSLIEKISQGNVNVASDLIKKVDNNELKKADLKNAWALVKAEKIEKGMKLAANGYEKRRQERQEKKEYNGVAGVVGLKASEIVNALAKNIRQINPFYGDSIKLRGINNKKRLFTEFGVNTGSTHHARRFDVLIAENETCRNKHDLKLHGIEIKVDKHDLLNDHKMAEYVDFCDTFWVAIPDNTEMVTAAESIRMSNWGLLVISEQGRLKVIHKAVEKEGLMRTETINNIAVKLL